MAVLLGAGVAGYNLLAEKPVGGVEEFSLLAGFLSYKVNQKMQLLRHAT